jgi:hypothetical protein
VIGLEFESQTIGIFNRSTKSDLLLLKKGTANIAVTKVYNASKGFMVHSVESGIRLGIPEATLL